MKKSHLHNLPQNKPKTFLIVFLFAIGILCIVNLLTGQELRSDASHKGYSPNQSACSSNVSDTCILAPTVDLYPAGSEDATNPLLRNQKDDVRKSIGGVITDITDQNIKLRTSSGRVFTVTFPVAIQAWWNKNDGPHHDNYQMGVGDTVRIDYLEPADHASNTINSDQISSAVLAIDPKVSPTEPIRRYPNK